MPPQIVRSLAFPIDSIPPNLQYLLTEFRLLVNRSIRIALGDKIQSRYRLAKVAYFTLSDEHHVHKRYISSAFDVALAVLKNYRRRVRRGRTTNVPYVHRLFLKANNQSYWLDRETGRLRIPIQGTQGVQLTLALSAWHRSILNDPSWGLGSLTVTPERIVVVVRKDAPKPCEPGGREGAREEPSGAESSAWVR